MRLKIFPSFNLNEFSMNSSILVYFKEKVVFKRRINTSATIFCGHPDNFLKLREVRNSQEKLCLHSEYPKTIDHGDMTV